MSYADGLLATGERVVHREKQHWWVFVWGARFTILAIVIAIIFFFLGGTLEPSGVSGTARTILGWVTAILFVGGLALLFWTTLRYLNQEYVLTRKGLALFPLLVALRQWGEQYFFADDEDHVRLVDLKTGRPVRKLELRAHDGRLLGPGDTRVKRPAAGAAPRRPTAKRARP